MATDPTESEIAAAIAAAKAWEAANGVPALARLWLTADRERSLAIAILAAAKAARDKEAQT